MVLDIRPFTDEQWYAMCDANISLPVPLAKADLTKPFIYDRKWGLFYVPGGRHQIAAATLLAFHHGFRKAYEILELNIDNYADTYFETVPGTAFKSSVGTRLVRTWSPQSLTAVEKRILGPCQYLNPADAW